MARFVFCLKNGMRADRFLDPSPGLIFVAVFTKQYRGGNYFRVANMDPLCEFGNRVFFIFRWSLSLIVRGFLSLLNVVSGGSRNLLGGGGLGS